MTAAWLVLLCSVANVSREVVVVARKATTRTLAGERASLGGVVASCCVEGAAGLASERRWGLVRCSLWCLLKLLELACAHLLVVEQCGASRFHSEKLRECAGLGWAR